jgi:O-antigen/teichoic acid export membrane protein
MIGIFLPPAAVGQYAAVRPLLRPISVVWMSMIWMYTPLVSSLTARSAMDRLQRIYLAMTKWFCLLTYPLAVTVALFPRPILLALFGPEYAPASLALRLVAAGYFLGNFFGPTGATLTGLGHTKVLLAANAAAAALNLLLNAALIPRFGLAGAALGTITAQSARNALRLVVLYRRHGVHALRGEFVVPTLVATLVVLAARGAVALLGPPGVGGVAAFAGLTFLVYLATYPATGSVNAADREMAERLYRKTRVTLGRVPALGS